MKQKIRKILFFFAGSIVSFACCAADFAIATGNNPALPVGRAAEELKVYLDRISGGSAAVSPKTIEGKFNIVLDTANDPALGNEGYRLKSDGKSLLISANTPLGILYGAYGFLEDVMGVRWFAPGAENEYVPKSPSPSIPVMDQVFKPDFTLRSIGIVNAGGGKPLNDTWDWMVRNRLQLSVKPQRDSRFMRERGAYYFDGGHVLMRIVPDTLFEAHPEYFALVNGKRIRQSDAKGRHLSQPCTTNPEVIKMTIEYLDRYFKNLPEGKAVFHIGNNDVQTWCECEHCRALDPPSEREKGYVSTRFYTFINEVAKEVLKRNPKAEIRAWGYQNFRVPPESLRPDPRIQVGFCTHQRCYRHSIADKNCALNGWYREVFAKWIKSGVRVSERGYQEVLMNEDEYFYLPIEKAIADDLKYYKAAGVTGYSYIITPPDAYVQWMKNPERQKKVLAQWDCLWQSLFVAAKLMWDADRDYEKLCEDMGSKYYGGAWPAMKKYRALLAKSFLETPGHTVYGGSGLSIGKCLEDPSVHAKLKEYLAEADKMAGNDSVVQKRVARDGKFFSLLWEKNAKEYENLRKNEVTAPRTSGRIVIDGRLDEPDWKKTSFTTGFVLQNKPGKLAVNQSFCKILFDGENLYFGLVASEVDTNNLRNEVTRRDGPVWTDNGFEIYISDDKGGYFQYVINNLGTIYDAGPGGDTAFDGKAEAKTIAGTRDIVTEVKIPLAPLKLKPAPGALLSVNVTRLRRLKDKAESESSSWSNGAWNEVSAFRKVVAGSSVIPNGTFSDLADADPKNKTVKSRKWAKGWGAGGFAASLETDPDKSPCIAMKESTIYRLMKLKEGTAGKLAGEIRISGKGTFRVRLSTCVRAVNDNRPFAHEKKRVILEGALSPEAKLFQFENVPVEAGEQGYVYIEAQEAKVYHISAGEQ